MQAFCDQYNSYLIVSIFIFGNSIQRQCMNFVSHPIQFQYISSHLHLSNNTNPIPDQFNTQYNKTKYIKVYVWGGCTPSKNHSKDNILFKWLQTVTVTITYSTTLLTFPKWSPSFYLNWELVFYSLIINSFQYNSCQVRDWTIHSNSGLGSFDCLPIQYNLTTILLYFNTINFELDNPEK